jgi:hypothetical protein
VVLTGDRTLKLGTPSGVSVGSTGAEPDDRHCAEAVAGLDGPGPVNVVAKAGVPIPATPREPADGDGGFDGDGHGRKSQATTRPSPSTSKILPGMGCRRKPSMARSHSSTLRVMGMAWGTREIMTVATMSGARSANSVSWVRNNRSARADVESQGS